MVARAVLKTSYWPAEAGQVRDITVCETLQIAPHKIPVFWSFVDGLPMTPTGKTQKYVLRQQAADGTLTFDEVRPPKSVSQALGEDKTTPSRPQESVAAPSFAQ